MLCASAAGRPSCPGLHTTECLPATRQILDICLFSPLLQNPFRTPPISAFCVQASPAQAGRSASAAMVLVSGCAMAAAPGMCTADMPHLANMVMHLMVPWLHNAAGQLELLEAKGR